jgi:hypothetical protein
MGGPFVNGFVLHETGIVNSFRHLLWRRVDAGWLIRWQDNERGWQSAFATEFVAEFAHETEAGVEGLLLAGVVDAAAGHGLISIRDVHAN